MVFGESDSEQAQDWMSQNNGIELIYQVPTLDELHDKWRRWQKMSKKKQNLSDQKSLELFGMTNQQHYTVLELLYI